MITRLKLLCGSSISLVEKVSSGTIGRGVCLKVDSNGKFAAATGATRPMYISAGTGTSGSLLAAEPIADDGVYLIDVDTTDSFAPTVGSVYSLGSGGDKLVDNTTVQTVTTYGKVLVESYDSTAKTAVVRFTW